MNDIKEKLKELGITADDALNFRQDKIVNFLIEWMTDDNKSLLGDIFTAKTFEVSKEYQGRYKQNERVISLINLLRGE